MNTENYWTTLCGSSPSEWAFWSTNVTWNTYDPDFTLCFEATIFPWLNFGLLLALSLHHIPQLYHKPLVHRGWSKFNIIKMVLALAVAFLFLMDFFKTVSENGKGLSPRPVLYMAPVFNFLSLIIVAFVTRYEFRKGVHSSATLFLFWFLSAILSIFVLRTKIRFINIGGPSYDEFRSIVFIIAFILIIINWFLHFFADKKALPPRFLSARAGASSNWNDDQLLTTLGSNKRNKRNDDESQPLLSDEIGGGGGGPSSSSNNYDTNNSSSSSRDNLRLKVPCPELTASYPNRVTFYWLKSMLWKGYWRSLTGSDLFDLRPEDTCRDIVPKIETEWKRQIQLFREKMKSKGIQVGADGFLNIPKPKAPNGPQLQFRTSVDIGGPSSSRNQTGGPKKNGGPPGGGGKGGRDVANAKELDDKDRQPRPSFINALINVFGGYYALGGFLKLVYDLLTFVQPQLLNQFISFITSNDDYIWRGFFYGACLFLMAMFRTMIFQHYWHYCYVTGLRLRTATIGLIYRKALRLSSTARRDTTIGEIVNLMSVDAQKLQDVPGFLHMIWSAPITIALAIYFLWAELGPSVLAGLAVMICLIPVNAVLASKQRKLQITQLRWKDQRIKLMSEILGGIKVLKLYAWEPSFEEKINNIRQKEVYVLRAAAYLGAISAISWFCAPFLVALSSFAVYVLSSPENILDANKAFVSLSLFNILNFPMSILPGVIATVIQTIVSLTRINKFLCHDEISQAAITLDHKDVRPINVKSGTFSWGIGDPDVLHDINFSVEPGSLVAIVGTVGSGKSSLINAILGEMVKNNGQVHVRGNIALVPQQAWCQNSSLQDNILFGKPFETHRYKKVISSCALEPDLRILPGGDMTEIGEKGINLSGGQKQRIGLARAVYQDADIYLLDDPLSAVDSHVGKHLFDEVIGPRGMLNGKTRVLVTHGITFLPNVDKIVVIKEGKISEVGTYKDLLQHNGAFAEFIHTYLEQEDKDDISDIEEQLANDDFHEDETRTFKEELRRHVSRLSGQDIDFDDKKSTSRKSSRQITPAERFERQTSRIKSRQLSRRHSSVKEALTQAQMDSKRKLISEEAAQTGDVKLRVFLIYLKAASYFMVLTTIVCYLLYMACSVGANLWLSVWSESPIINGTQDPDDRDFYLGIYGSFGFGQAIFILGENFALAYATYSASSKLHSMILSNILKAPMSFFDTTPIGRIVNRFSKDIDTIDINIPQTFRIWLATFAGVLSSIVVISIASPYFLVALLPLGFVYYFVQRFYINTSRQLKRIDSIKRSPIYSHFQESVVGVTSIRAYKKQGVFIDKSDQMVDDNQMAYYPNIVSYRWLGVNLEIIGNCVILLSAIFAVLSRGGASAGLAALSVTYSLQITGALNYMVRMTSDLETYVVAVERLEEYTTIEKEAAWETNIRPPSNWPMEGNVQFRNYSVRYREGLDLILKDLSFSITGGEKVGIVGRTGAGKSSLTLALFRILEPATGSIFIDNVDIARIGLHDLRGCLTIIPQDPVIFSGSLRMNLDPFDVHHDGQIWTALEHSHLKQFVLNQPEGLNFMCSEGGDNLSVGQRQLLCLARALLRKTKILILDEATAAVDLETDSLIQHTIRQEFRDCTVLTIAHRLNTIMDYDKVMVLDRGRIHEFDKPTELLKNEKTIFHSMAKDAGLI